MGSCLLVKSANIMLEEQLGLQCQSHHAHLSLMCMLESIQKYNVLIAFVKINYRHHLQTIRRTVAMDFWKLLNHLTNNVMMEIKYPAMDVLTLNVGLNGAEIILYTR